MLNIALLKKCWIAMLFIFFITSTALILVIKGIKIEHHDEKKHYAWQFVENNYSRLAGSMDGENIVFLGSSSIAGLDTGSITSGAINLGINGEKLQQLQKRVNTYEQLPTVKAVVFMAGFNDVCDGSNIAYHRFDNVVQDLSSVALLIVGLQPAFSTVLCNNLEENIVDYNNKLINFCSYHDNCEYVDLSGALNSTVKEELDFIEKYFEEDGIHLNQRGYRLLEEEIAKSLDKLT